MQKIKNKMKKREGEEIFRSRFFALFYPERSKKDFEVFGFPLQQLAFDFQNMISKFKRYSHIMANKLSIFMNCRINYS